MKSGAFFIGLPGENFDGNAFVPQAFKLGAALAMSSSDLPDLSDLPETSPVIYVQDTRTALADLARYYRKLFDIKIAGITGSTGKTSVKEMLAAVLQSRYKTLKTEGNYNNEIGLPSTLLRLEKEHEAAVIEMGMSNSGEISRLSKIALPDVGIITNIGISHIENLGSRDGILKAKMEIIDGMAATSPLVLNGDDDKLISADPKGHPVIFYGIKNLSVCEVRAENIKFENIKTSNESKNQHLWSTRFDLLYDGKRYDTVLPVSGEHNIYNALAAFSAAVVLGVKPERAVCALLNFRGEKSRLDISVNKGVTIIDDCYNASPDSLRAALEVLTIVAQGRKIAVLGDMMELGARTEQAHLQAGEKAAEAGVEILVCNGERAKFIAESGSKNGMQSYWFATHEETANFLNQTLLPSDTVLFKASRYMKFEEIIPLLRIKL